MNKTGDVRPIAYTRIKINAPAGQRLTTLHRSAFNTWTPRSAPAVATRGSPAFKFGKFTAPPPRLPCDVPVDTAYNG